MPKILLVEDNEMNRDMLYRRLKRVGYEVVIAVDGAESVSMSSIEKPDLILMDIDIPVLNGWEATLKIKNNPETKAIPVIAVSAHSEHSLRDKSSFFGCDDCEPKPIQFKRLLNKIETLLPKNLSPIPSLGQTNELGSTALEEQTTAMPLLSPSSSQVCMTKFTNVARLNSENKLIKSNRKNTLTEQLNYLGQGEFTGCLEVQSRAGKQWKLYFYLSRLVWASGGDHPNRSWLRHLAKYCSGVDKSKIAMVGSDQFECQNYHTLTVLLKREMISREQLRKLVKSKIAEILFDIVQIEATEQVYYTSQVLKADFLLASGLKMSLAIVDVKQALLATQQAWSAWCQKGLGGCRPSLAPSLRQHEKTKTASSKNYLPKPCQAHRWQKYSARFGVSNE